METSKDRKVLVPILLLYRDHSGVPIVSSKEVFFGLNEPNGYQQLINFIRSFPETANLNKEDYSLSYLDLDNDQIPVQSEAEFIEYLKVCKLAKSKGKVRALQVCEKGKEYKMSVEVNKLWSENAVKVNEGIMPKTLEQSKNHPTTSISSSSFQTKVRSQFQDSYNLNEVPKWFSEEMQKLKKEMIRSMKMEVFSEMATVMRNFAQEVHVAAEKSTKDKEDEKKLEMEQIKIEIELLKADIELKKSKKSKEKKKSEKKEKAKALGNNSAASKPMKEKPAKLNSTNGAFNLAGMKSFDGCTSKPEKSSTFRDHILPCQKRICLNEEKKNKLYAVAKRKKDCPQKARKISEQVKCDFMAEVKNQLRFSSDNMKKDAECHRFKMNDPSFFPSSSDSDQREGLEESDDIVVVGFNSSFDEISDSDLSLEGLVPGASNKERSVDVEVPACFFPEVPVAFKSNNLPLRLKQSDVEGLKSKTSTDRVFPPSKKSRSKAKKCDKNAFMVDEKGICHTVEQWKELEKEWQVIGKSFDDSAEVLNQIVDDLEHFNSSESNLDNSSCSEYSPKLPRPAEKTETNEKFENGEASKLNPDQRNDSAGTKKTVSEMLLSREPPHSDVIKERKRKKDPNFDRLMDMMLRLCKSPTKESLSRKNDSNSKLETGANLASNPTDQDSTSQLKQKAFPNEPDKLEDRYLLKSLHSSDESSTSDYEECEETNKANGKSNLENSSDPVSAFHPIINKSKIDVAVANKAVGAAVEEDPMDKVISFLTITGEENLSQGIEAGTSNKMTTGGTLDSMKTYTQSYATNKVAADNLLDAAQQSYSTHKMATGDLLDTLKQNHATSSTRASQTSNAGSSNDPSKFSFAAHCYNAHHPFQKTAKTITDALRAAAGANLDSFNTFVKNTNPAPHDSATSSFFNANKNAVYPPQQIPQQPGAPLSTSSSYNPFTTGPSFFSDLYPNGYPYVHTPYMPLPKNFSCSQSFQSSQSAQNLIPKPTIPPPPPPIVIPPHMPQDKHFYFHQPAYNTLYTNSVNPYYTNPQFNAFLNKGDPLKNCPALKRDPTYTTPVMGHIYPSVYPIYYPPSTVPLNNSQNNLTTVLPPVATPATNFTPTPLPTTEQPSNTGNNSQLQNSASKNEKATPNATLSKTFSEATMGKNELSSSNVASCNNETATLDVASGVNEASAPAAPCGIEVSSSERSPKPSVRLNIADFISERFLSTLNSAATNVKEAFAPSRSHDDKRNGAQPPFRTDDVFPELINAFLHKKPIHVHILHQSTRERYFVMPHKNVAQSHTFHCDLRSHMKYEKRRAVCTLEAGLIYALHENLPLSKEDKDTWSRVKLLSIEGTLIRAQKIDFGVIVHCDSHNLTQLPDKFKSMPALVAEVAFSDLTEPNIIQMSPLFVKPLQYFPDDNYWMVKICENLQESYDSGSVAMPAFNVAPSRVDMTLDDIINFERTSEGVATPFEDAPLDNGGEAIAYEQLEQSLDDKIKFLQDIGFKGEEDLRNLLILNNEDMSDVIDILTSSAVGNYYFSTKQ